MGFKFNENERRKTGYPLDLRMAAPVDGPEFERPLIRASIETGVVEVRQLGSDEVTRYEAGSAPVKLTLPGRPKAVPNSPRVQANTSSKHEDKDKEADGTMNELAVARDGQGLRDGGTKTVDPAEIDPRLPRVIELYKSEEKTQLEIAKELGVAPVTAVKLINKAIAAGLMEARPPGWRKKSARKETRANTDEQVSQSAVRALANQRPVAPAPSARGIDEELRRKVADLGETFRAFTVNVADVSNDLVRTRHDVEGLKKDVAAESKRMEGMNDALLDRLVQAEKRIDQIDQNASDCVKAMAEVAGQLLTVGQRIVQLETMVHGMMHDFKGHVHSAGGQAVLPSLLPDPPYVAKYEVAKQPVSSGVLVSGNGVKSINPKSTRELLRRPSEDNDTELRFCIDEAESA